MRFQAHRGVNTEFPENTLVSYRAAIEQGYHIIELDPKVTADGQFVMHHDRSINRTARKEDGSIFAEKTDLSSLSLSELKEFDFGLFKDEKFRGTRIPTLEETLDLIVSANISIKIDNVFQSFTPEQIDRFFSEIKNAGHDELIGFTCTTKEMLQRVTKEFPYSEIHWDSALDEGTKSLLLSSIKNNRFTVWIPYDNDYTSWFQGTHANTKSCEYIKTFADLGIWTISTTEELKGAIGFNADVIETNGEIKPKMIESLT